MGSHPLSSRPSVSVVIPTYNRADWLPETVASVLSQTVVPDEIIIVDDGSTDHTEDLCSSFPHPVRYVRQENAGVGAARNRGMEEASGEFIGLVDSDDVWEPSKLEVQLEFHRRRPELGWSVTNAITVGLDGNKLAGNQGFARNFGVFRAMRETPEEFFTRWFESMTIHAGGAEHLAWYGDAFTPLFHGNFTSPTCVLLRRDVVDEAGMFDVSFRLAEETEYFHRVAAVAPLGIIATPLFRWRVGQVVSLVSAANVVTLIRNALESGARAARLRTPLPPEAAKAWAAGRRRLLYELAYTHLSLREGAQARSAAQEVWAAGSRSPKLMALWMAGWLPRWALAGMHAVKRALA